MLSTKNKIFSKNMNRSINNEWLIIKIIILFSVVGSLLWMITIPYNDANDEYLHYAVVRFVADRHQLPIYNKDDYTEIKCYRTDSPYFFGKKIINIPVCQSSYSIFPFPSYIISALPVFFIQKNAPYRYLFARLPNIIYFVIFLFLVWGIIKKVFSSEYIRQMTIIIIAFIPQITFINSYVNSDGFSMMIGASVIYMWIKCLDDGLTTKNMILGAISLGLLASAKYNYFALFPATAILFLFSYRRFTLNKILKFLGVAFIGIIVISGWWFIRNYFLYGDALGFSTVKKTLAALAPDNITIADFGHNFLSTLLITNWPIQSFKSFFAVFGWMSIYLPNIFYLITLLFLFATFFGWLFTLVNIIFEKKKFNFLQASHFPFFAASLAAIIITISLSVWTSLHNDFQPQGRYLFPALIPAILIIIKGLRSFSKMMRFNEKLILSALACWMTILWIASHIILLVHYLILPDNIPGKELFTIREVHFMTNNKTLIIYIVLGGSILISFLIWRIWKHVLRNFDIS